MKKIIIFAVLLFAMCVCAQAQHWIGVRGGYNISDISSEPYFKTNSYSSINYGLIYRNYLDRNMGLQVEINAMERGYSRRSDSIARISQTYELPVLAHGRLEFGNFIPYLAAGFYVGLIHTLKQKDEHKNATTGKQPLDFAPRDRRFEGGAKFAGGIAVRIAKRFEVFAEFAYSYSFTYIFTPQYKKETTMYVQPTNMQISFGVTYRIAGKLKGKRIKYVEPTKDEIMKSLAKPAEKNDTNEVKETENKTIENKSENKDKETTKEK